MPYVDIARDVDDAVALTYMAGHPNAKIVSLVTTHAIPDRRAFIAKAFLEALNIPDVPIGVGSIFPLGQEDAMVDKYLRDHSIVGVTYEGQDIVPVFENGVDLILKTIATHKKALKIPALAPLTDLAKAAQKDPDTFVQHGGLYIQGQATIKHGRLVPDPTAYNINEDLRAAHIIFDLQDYFPIHLLGKHAAYQVPFSRSDFEGFRNTGTVAGNYLESHALLGVQVFAKRAPEIFERVFGIPASRVDELTHLSKPYDALAVKVILDPAGMRAQQIGEHALYGMTSEDNGIDNAALVKADLIDKMHRGLAKAALC